MHGKQSMYVRLVRFRLYGEDTDGHTRHYVKSFNGRFSGSFSQQLATSLQILCGNSFIATLKTERRPENHFSQEIYVTFGSRAFGRRESVQMAATGGAHSVPKEHI